MKLAITEARQNRELPIGLASAATLVRDVPKGSAITYVTAGVLSRCGRSSVADVTTAPPPGRYEMSLTTDDVGARVVVRRRLAEG